MPPPSVRVRNSAIWRMVGRKPYRVVPKLSFGAGACLSICLCTASLDNLTGVLAWLYHHSNDQGPSTATVCGL
jgi:hypothetical protein